MAKKGIKQETSKKSCCDFTFWILIIGMLAIGISGLMLHIRIHPQYAWLTYILLFDIIIITLLYFSKKSITYGFLLNTVFFIVGVIAHFSVLGLKGGIGDVLISIPDFAMGYVLWILYK